MVKLPNYLSGSQDKINKRFLKWLRELKAELADKADTADLEDKADTADLNALEERVQALEDKG